MHESIQLIQLPPGGLEDALAFLDQEIPAFAESGKKHCAIDLSTLPVLVSVVIRRLAIYMREANQKGGTTLLYMPRSVMCDLLAAIRFDRLAILIRDKDEFKAACENPRQAIESSQIAQKNRGQDSEPQPSPPRRKAPSPVSRASAILSSDISVRAGWIIAALAAATIALGGIGALGLSLHAAASQSRRHADQLVIQKQMIDSLAAELQRIHTAKSEE